MGQVFHGSRKILLSPGLRQARDISNLMRDSILWLLLWNCALELKCTPYGFQNDVLNEEKEQHAHEYSGNEGKNWIHLRRLQLPSSYIHSSYQSKSDDIASDQSMVTRWERLLSL
jgi:hypothetical protein